jgi:hypothetical protein
MGHFLLSINRRGLYNLARQGAQKGIMAALYQPQPWNLTRQATYCSLAAFVFAIVLSFQNESFR